MTTSALQVFRTNEIKSPTLRVMVVDDNVDAAKTLAILLKAIGHEVHTVHDGPAALNATPQFRPNLILLDVGLPGMDGFDVARRLRADPGFGTIVLIAVTGYGQETDKQRSRDAGFDYHLVKPADFNEIKQILDAIAKEIVIGSA